jgi:hypothetical protein
MVTFLKLFGLCIHKIKPMQRRMNLQAIILQERRKALLHNNTMKRQEKWKAWNYTLHHHKENEVNLILRKCGRQSMN